MAGGWIFSCHSSQNRAVQPSLTVLAIALLLFGVMQGVAPGSGFRYRTGGV